MNLLVICADTFRADHLDVYGDSTVETPHLDALARESAVFLDACGEGLPALPARRVLFTGRRVFPFEMHLQPDDGVQLPGWHPLYAEDVTLANTLLAAGYTTGLITDLPHVMKPGKNFHRGFRSWRFVRGQEDDHFRSGPRDVDTSRVLRPETPDGSFKEMVKQYLRNRQDWRTEEDYFVAQVMRKAAAWLEENVSCQPFFLWVDCFDPHEPWDPPNHYSARYDPDYRGIDEFFPQHDRRPDRTAPRSHSRSLRRRGDPG